MVYTDQRLKEIQEILEASSQLKIANDIEWLKKHISSRNNNTQSKDIMQLNKLLQMHEDELQHRITTTINRMKNSVYG